MRNAIVGLIIGIVAGIVFGTTVIAPRVAKVSAGAGQTAAPMPSANADADAEADAGAETKTAPEAKPDTTPVKTAANIAADAPAATPAPAAPVEPAPAPSLRWRMASAYPESLPLHGTAAKRLETLIWRLSGGTFEIAFNAPGALVAETDAVAAVRSGAIDAAFVPTDTLADLDPAMSLFAGPPFGASIAAYLGWMDGGSGRARMQEVLANFELHGLLCGMVPNAGGGWFRTPLRTAEDLRGLRIRAEGIEATLLRRLGADVVRRTYAETVGDIEQGKLDAAVLSAPHVDVALGTTWAGATYYVPGWRVPAKTFILLTGLDSWNNLEPVQKYRLQTACGDNLRIAISSNEALQYSALKKIVASGTDVRPWPAEIQDAVQEVWQAEAKDRQRASQSYGVVLQSYRAFIKGQSIWEDLVRP